MPTPATPGRTGRRAPRPERLARALMFGQFWTGAVPAHPTAVDNLARLGGGWQMLGNDAAGDCVAVTWANFRRLVTAVLGGREVYPTQEQVWAIYRTQNPGFDPHGTAATNGPGSDQDQGMEIQALLEYLVAHGGPDGAKALAFAKVNHNDPEEVAAALAIFGGVWTGLLVQQAQQGQFAAGADWDWVPGSPVEGGHSVLAGGYGGGHAVKFITWATETELTNGFLLQGVEEMWLVVWPEHLGSRAFLEGVDQNALAKAYTALTGRPFPVAPTPPAPAPGPAPVPGPADPHLADDLALVNATRAFRLARHGHGSEAAHAVAALERWIAACGYVS